MNSHRPRPSDPAAGAWTSWTVLHRPAGHRAAASSSARAATADLRDVVAALPEGVVLRGVYDVSGLRRDADLMIWLVGRTPEQVQGALRSLRHATELVALEDTWAALGVHRPAEFSADHAPAYMRGTEPRAWLTVYPFVRSYDWYLLPDDERRSMLAEHGGKGRRHTGVLANTVAAFALGDYEWLLGLEADDLTELVDLMRDLRSTEARRHVREEVPFFTGRRIGLDEVSEVLR